MAKRFERKWTDEQIRAVRFDYEGMSARQVSTITGIPLHTVRAYRRGVRGGVKSRKLAPRERWRHMKQQELRLFFLEKCRLLLALYHRMQERLDETGDYTQPEARELAIRQSGDIIARRLVPDEAVVERQPEEREPDPAPRQLQATPLGPPLLPEARRSRPRLTGTTGLLFTRR